MFEVDTYFVDINIDFMHYTITMCNVHITGLPLQQHKYRHLDKRIFMLGVAFSIESFLLNCNLYLN